MGRRVTRRGFLRGMAGAGGVAAAADAAVAQEDGVNQRVRMTDELVFDPETVYVQPGADVIWENVGSVGHSVTAYEDEIPADAEYFASGGFDSEQAARAAYPDQGDIGAEENYRHTFEVEGTYGYFCIPHENVGMVGTVEVTTEPPEPTGFVSILPDNALTLGIAAVAALVTVLALAWTFLKYGGDYGE